MGAEKSRTSFRSLLGIGIFLLSYILLIPGLIYPMLTIQASAEKAELVALGKQMISDNPETSFLMASVADLLIDQMDTNGNVVAYEKTRSILGTVKDLFDKKYYLVSFLIVFFSVIVPVIKGIMMLFAYMKISPAISARMKFFSSLISKWSMADVFVIGVFVAFLAANAIEKEAGLLSFEAILHSGFYFFLGYCLLSILSSQLLSEEI